MTFIFCHTLLILQQCFFSEKKFAQQFPRTSKEFCLTSPGKKKKVAMSHACISGEMLHKRQLRIFRKDKRKPNGKFLGGKISLYTTGTFNYTRQNVTSQTLQAVEINIHAN